MAAFFTSLLPQFAPAGGGSFWVMLGLGLLFCALTFAWLCAYVVAVARAGDWLRRPRFAVRRGRDRLTSSSRSACAWPSRAAEALNQAAAPACSRCPDGSRREMTFETPSPPIETP